MRNIVEVTKVIFKFLWVIQLIEVIPLFGFVFLRASEYCPSCCKEVRKKWSTSFINANDSNISILSVRCWGVTLGEATYR